MTTTQYLCITAAVWEEMKGIKKGLHLEKVSGSKETLYTGKYNNHNLLLLKTGVGESNTKKTLSALLQTYSVTIILSVGFAGGVSAKLNTADLFLCTSLLHQDGGTDAYHPDTSLVAAANNLSCKTLYSGASLTVGQLISSVDQKKKIGEKYQVQAVEMENYHIATIAKKKNISFLMVRAISDTISDDISFLDPLNGNFSKRKIALYAITHPEIIPGLNRLRKKSDLAQKALISFIEQFLTQL